MYVGWCLESLNHVVMDIWLNFLQYDHGMDTQHTHLIPVLRIEVIRHQFLVW